MLFGMTAIWKIVCIASITTLSSKDSSYLEWEERGLYPAPFTWDEPKDVDWGE
jgi:hypothetical protein